MMAARHTKFVHRVRLSWMACAFGIVAVTMLAYVPALRGGFVWDDDAYVTENRALKTSDGLKAIWLEPRALPQYYPLVHTSFWVEYHLWGLRPLGYHLVNVVLHAASALLFWRLLRGLSVPGAYLAAVVFAVHPVHVESVAWITERKNVLSGLFYLAAALAYLRFARIGATASTRTQQERGTPDRWRWYGVAFVLFLCALFSKTVTCSFPAAILLILWWRYDRVRMRDVAALAPLFLLGAAMGFVTAWLEVHHVRAEGAQWDLSFLERSLLAGRAVWFYLGKLLWPAHLCFVYRRWQIDTHIWWQYVFPMAVVITVAVLWLIRGRIGKGPLVAFLLFCGTLLPALGFFDVYPMRFSYVADHFQYHASLGVIAVAVAALYKVLGLLPWRHPALGNGADPQRQSVFLPFATKAAIVLALGVTTWRQAGNYRDLETLWRATLAENPTAWLAYGNLGLVLVDQGRTDEALALLAQARELEPESAELRLASGFVLLRAGRLEESYTELSRFVATYPTSARGRALLGAVQARRSNIGDAIRHYREALRLKPDALEARAELAFLLANEGYADEAIREYEQLLTYDPRNADAMVELGFTLRAIGRDADAKLWFRRAVRLKPELTERIRPFPGTLDKAPTDPG